MPVTDAPKKNYDRLWVAILLLILFIFPCGSLLLLASIPFLIALAQLQQEFHSTPLFWILSFIVIGASVFIFVMVLRLRGPRPPASNK